MYIVSRGKRQSGMRYTRLLLLSFVGSRTVLSLNLFLFVFFVL